VVHSPTGTVVKAKVKEREAGLTGQMGTMGRAKGRDTMVGRAKVYSVILHQSASKSTTSSQPAKATLLENLERANRVLPRMTAATTTGEKARVKVRVNQDPREAPSTVGKVARANLDPRMAATTEVA